MKLNIYTNYNFHIKQEKIIFLILFLIIIQSTIKYKESLKKEIKYLNNIYIKIKNDLNLTFNNKFIKFQNN